MASFKGHALVVYFHPSVSEICADKKDVGGTTALIIQKTAVRLG